jgi:hypothetical protein
MLVRCAPMYTFQSHSPIALTAHQPATPHQPSPARLCNISTHRQRPRVLTRRAHSHETSRASLLIHQTRRKHHPHPQMSEYTRERRAVEYNDKRCGAALRCSARGGRYIASIAPRAPHARTRQSLATALPSPSSRHCRAARC